jgi:RNA polymerase sigma-70 factor (ECF subfamily)
LPAETRPARQATRGDERRHLVALKERAPTISVNEADETLMLRAGRGDRLACQRLVERHLQRIVGFARRVLGGGDEAEDVAQEVFLRVWAAAPRWKQSARFTTWLYRVAMNACLDRLAKKREILGDELPDVADPRPGPSEVAQSLELARRVRAALASLPESQRIALGLCHDQGLRNIEAAEIMGISVEALESLLARGRRSVGAQLRAAAPELLERG